MLEVLLILGVSGIANFFRNRKNAREEAREVSKNFAEDDRDIFEAMNSANPGSDCIRITRTFGVNKKSRLPFFKDATVILDIDPETGTGWQYITF